jgi:SAM-dependent methyltransferase
VFNPLPNEQSSADKVYDSYDPIYFSRLAQIEHRHFWFQARNLAIGNLVARLVAGWPKGYNVLEVGCGTGNVLRVLEQVCVGGNVVGMDIFIEGLAFARQRTTCGLVLGDAENPPFLAKFQLIGAFDVIEHIANDSQTLRSLHKMLVPGGFLLLTVPAYQDLWSYFDAAAHHCRRYEPAALRQKLVEIGYQVQFLSPFMASTYPLIWAGRRFAGLLRRSKKSESSKTDHELAMQELQVIPVINSILSFVLAQEARLIGRQHALPFGSSLIVIAQKAK